MPDFLLRSHFLIAFLHSVRKDSITLSSLTLLDSLFRFFRISLTTTTNCRGRPWRSRRTLASLPLCRVLSPLSLAMERFTPIPTPSSSSSYFPPSHCICPITSLPFRSILDFRWLHLSSFVILLPPFPLTSSRSSPSSLCLHFFTRSQISTSSFVCSTSDVWCLPLRCPSPTFAHFLYFGRQCPCTWLLCPTFTAFISCETFGWNENKLFKFKNWLLFLIKIMSHHHDHDHNHNHLHLHLHFYHRHRHRVFKCNDSSWSHSVIPLHCVLNVALPCRTHKSYIYTFRSMTLFPFSAASSLPMAITDCTWLVFYGFLAWVVFE